MTEKVGTVNYGIQINVSNMEIQSISKWSANDWMVTWMRKTSIISAVKIAGTVYSCQRGVWEKDPLWLIVSAKEKWVQTSIEKTSLFRQSHRLESRGSWWHFEQSCTDYVDTMEILVSPLLIGNWIKFQLISCMDFASLLTTRVPIVGSWQRHSIYYDPVVKSPKLSIQKSDNFWRLPFSSNVFDVSINNRKAIWIHRTLTWHSCSMPRIGYKHTKSQK